MRYGAERVISMLRCKITGTCLKVYIKEYTTKEGVRKSINMADVYVSPALIQIAKVPDKLLGEGVPIENFPVKVYNGQYNLSVVYDDGKS